MRQLERMRYALHALIALAAAAGFVLFSGILVPREYEGSAALEVQAPPEAVWNLLVQPGGYPSWRSDVMLVEGVRGRDTLAWRETDARGGATRHTGVTVRPLAKFIDRFEALGAPGNRGVPGGVMAGRGERAILLVPADSGGTRIAIEEKGVIESPLARFRARFVDGYFAGVRKFATDLRKRLGE
jgi:hypothetical protein